MFELTPLPVSTRFLADYRLRSRRQKRSDLVGGHLTRRKGQSLDFRDFQPYLPGDDVRNIDWRASYRQGGSQAWLVRNYVSEEPLTLVISLDTRPTMTLPAAFPKYQMAAWVAEAIAKMALGSSDRVIFHRLFGASANSILPIRGRISQGRIRSFLAGGPGADLDVNTLNLSGLHSVLPPTAVWLIVSDFYFDWGEKARELARVISSKRDGFRWIIFLDLDSWPSEKRILGTGARRIEGPGFRNADPHYQIGPAEWDKLEQVIHGHKRRFFRLGGPVGCDRMTWHWPCHERPDGASFFKQCLADEPVLKRLFMRDR